MCLIYEKGYRYENDMLFSGDITRCGGTENVGCQIVNGLVDDYNVIVLSMTESNKEPFFCLSDKVTRYSLFDSNINGIKDYPKIVYRLRNFVRSKKIDIMIDIDTILDMFTVPALICMKTKLISWEHFNFNESMGNKFRVPIRKYVTRFSDCIVTLTKEDRDTYRNYMGKGHRVVHIYNPFFFDQTDDVYDLESKRIVSVGRFTTQKGFDMLVDVAQKVFERHPDWEWVILGDGQERENIERKINEKSVSNLKLLGKVNDVKDRLKKCSIYVMTSRYEGFPLVLIEAKESKLPVISFNCKTGPAELVLEGQNGYLIDCFDIDEMSRKICELIEDPEARKRFSDNSLLDTQKLSYDRIISKWKKLLSSY